MGDTDYQKAIRNADLVSLGRLMEKGEQQDISFECSDADGKIHLLKMRILKLDDQVVGLVTCPKCGNVLKHFEVLMEGVAKYDFILKYNDNSEVSPKYFPQYTLEEFMPKVGVQIKFGCSKCHWVFNSVDEKKAIEILKIGGGVEEYIKSKFGNSYKDMLDELYFQETLNKWF